MELSEVPESELVVASADPATLADALRSIVAEGKRFGFGAMTIVRGAPRTGRILLMNQRWDAVTLRSRLSPYGAVTEMTRLVRSEEARYDPPENPGMIQGWEIRKATVDGDPVAIIWTSWVPR
jgi:hypothetical protein